MSEDRLVLGGGTLDWPIEVELKEDVLLIEIGRQRLSLNREAARSMLAMLKERFEEKPPRDEPAPRSRSR